MSQDPKEELVDVSGNLLTAADQIRALERKRRGLRPADPSLDSIAKAIEGKARDAVRLARAQDDLVNQIPADDPESINDIAAERTWPLHSRPVPERRPNRE